MPKRKLIGGFILASAAVLTIVSGISLYFSFRFVERSTSVEGEVVENLKRSSGGNDYFYPIVAFQTIEGETVKALVSMGSFPPQYAVGDPVPLLYDTDDPKDVRIASFLGLWMIPFATGLLALFYFPLGYVVLRWERIRKLFHRTHPAARMSRN